MTTKVKDWASTDWTEQDIALAEELGVSRERIRQKRKELGKPRAINHYQRRVSYKKKFLELDTADKTVKEIAKILGCTTYSVYDLAGKSNKSFKRVLSCDYDWDSLDREAYETLPDKEIVKILGIAGKKSYNQVIRWRLKHGIHKTRGGYANSPRSE